MANPPWKRELPPEPPRRDGFLLTPPTSNPAGQQRPSSGPPTDPRLDQALSSTVGAGSSAGQKARKINPASGKLRTGIAGLILLLLVSGLLIFAKGDGSQSELTDNSSASSPIVTDVATTVSGAKAVPQGFWDKIARSVVYIQATGSRCGWAGSGSIILDGSYVLTNQHVSGSGECALNVFLTESTDKAPTRSLAAVLVTFSKTDDLAVLRIFGDDGKPFIDANHKPFVFNQTALSLGAKLFTLGYPDAGGSTITFTSGDYAGMDDVDGVYYKTTAYMNSGVSGGSGLNEAGELVGIPTAGKIDSVTNEKLGINLVRPVSYAIALIDEAKAKNPQNVSFETDTPVSGSLVDSEDRTLQNESSVDPIFGTCREAIRNGYGPYYRGEDYEYSFYLDRDGDGIVCE